MKKKQLGTITKNCPVCGGKYETWRGRYRVTCSRTCAGKARAVINRYIDLVGLEEASIEERPKVGVCECCWEDFEYQSKGCISGEQRFCSRACRKKAWDRDNKEKRQRINDKWLENNGGKAVQVWYSMKRRCLTECKIDPSIWRYYGGKGIKVLISKEDFVDIYNEATHCEKCKCEFPKEQKVRESKKGDWKSVDRIDSDGHYEIDNIQFLCLSCNTKKAHDLGRENRIRSLENVDRKNPTAQMRICDVCGKMCQGIKSKKYCSIKCKDKARRTRKKLETVT